MPPVAALAAPAGPLRSDPFTLGVASGDPDHEGFVLWTRLAPVPLAEDGLGGMPDRVVVVRWEVAQDPGFGRLVRRGEAVARPQWGHSVHVEVAGLRPGRSTGTGLGRWVRLAGGRTRTAPHPHTLGSALRMAFVSCAQFEHGYFTAYRRLAEDRPDVVLHLGDYQYEYTAGAYVIPGGNPRDHVGPETETLATTGSGMPSTRPILICRRRTRPRRGWSLG